MYHKNLCRSLFCPWHWEFFVSHVVEKKNIKTHNGFILLSGYKTTKLLYYTIFGLALETWPWTSLLYHNILSGIIRNNPFCFRKRKLEMTTKVISNLITSTTIWKITTPCDRLVYQRSTRLYLLRVLLPVPSYHMSEVALLSWQAGFVTFSGDTKKTDYQDIHDAFSYL